MNKLLKNTIKTMIYFITLLIEVFLILPVIIFTIIVTILVVLCILPIFIFSLPIAMFKEMKTINENIHINVQNKDLK